VADNMLNIRAFKDACDDFGIRFRNTDNRQNVELLLTYKVNGRIIINDKVLIGFVHSVNFCKVDIGNYESMAIHCELSTEWQDFKYDSSKKELSVSGKSTKFGHLYQVEISLPK
jgi:hypothetical protein